MGKKVAIVVGSQRDLPVIAGGTEILEMFGIPHEVKVLSAHRTPDETLRFAATAEARGFGVIIACAGLAAHLPGFIASQTVLPVIGVPLPAGDLKGIDALLSIVQMPSGVPVACMAVGEPGVKNAALFAVEILAHTHPQLRARLHAFRRRMKTQAGSAPASRATKENR